ncbi:unnamed protein product [Rotaria sp. Silwood2]|nr:unnamed protein product [Rotaria sp. Silwood2]CAF4161340.1 unnamed protein product [Rotaria sp. Silwood2]
MKDSETLLPIDNDDNDTKNNVYWKYENNNNKTMTNHEELVGGCCVCSDDQGFSNNVLVYCDGKGCTVACHTACYGIVSIPDGDWYCRRCEVGAIQAPCRLCPLKEGAMKQTSDGNWAHVICALYIPEVSFGNDETMEPIILSRIPSIRYGQPCSICIQNGRSKSDAIKGACCECRVKNCSQLFHVTCAQQAGLLYEDVRKNNCQYPIYCEYHRPKFSKFIRQVPAFQYQSSEQNHNSKEKRNPSELSDFFNNTIAQTNGSLLSERQEQVDNTTSQNSSQVTSKINHSHNIELNKQEQTSSSSLCQNQLISDTRDLSIVNLKSSNVNSDQKTSTSTCTNISSNVYNNLSSKETFTPKIKIEVNDIDYQIVEKDKLNKDAQLHKKRHYSNEDGPRLVGRLPSKKPYLSQLKHSNHSISPEKNLKPSESQTKNDQANIDFYSHQFLNNSSITLKTSEHSFPPQTLEEFLEQEWELTSDFLLEQNMPRDVSSLLSCLYQFKSENASLKKKFDELKHRRDSLRVINANLRRKLSETVAINETLNESSCLPKNNQQINKKSKSPVIEKQHKLKNMIPSDTEFISTNSTPSSSFSYEPIHPYVMHKNEPLPLTHGLSLELLSQIFTTSGPQLFAPTWNISNFGYANFPGANSISVSDEPIIRSYSSFQQ